MVSLEHHQKEKNNDNHHNKNNNQQESNDNDKIECEIEMGHEQNKQSPIPVLITVKENNDVEFSPVEINKPSDA